MKPKVIALTGPIGSGKSQVARILRELGHKTVDCDIIARQIADDPEVVGQVAELLGEQYVSDGKLNRKLIRERVFADGELLSKYQSLFFGKVRDRLHGIVAQTESALFVEIPVFDAFDFCWDGVWLVQCDRDKSVERVTRRDGVAADNVSAILDKQRQPAPTYVILNNGTLSELEQAVTAALGAMGLV